MAEQSDPQGTSQQTPPATSDEQKPPEATPPTNGKPEATPKEDETVTLSKKDYQNLIAARDKANQSNADSEDFMLQIAQERYIDDFLTKNQKDYPYLERSDLLHVFDPDKVEGEAKRLQKRFADIVQKELFNVQNPKRPELTPDQKSEQIKKLKADKSAPGRFAKLASLHKRN